MDYNLRWDYCAQVQVEVVLTQLRFVDLQKTLSERLIYHAFQICRHICLPLY